MGSRNADGGKERCVSKNASAMYNNIKSVKCQMYCRKIVKIYKKNVVEITEVY